MGPDWNQDGQHDWQDDALFHNVISDNSGDDGGHGNHNMGCGTILFILLIIWGVIELVAKLFG